VIKYWALLTEDRALLTPYRALLLQYRALSMGYTALLTNVDRALLWREAGFHRI